MVDEQEQQQIFEEVNPSELGQLSPGYTPYNPELQTWSRGRSLGRGGDNYRTQQSTTLPEFTALESEDLSAVAREIAVHLHQIGLDSREHVTLDNREQEATQKQPTEPVQHQGQQQLETTKEAQQDKVPLDSTDLNKLDTRLQGSEQQKEATPTESTPPQEQEKTQDKDQEKDHER